MKTFHTFAPSQTEAVDTDVADDTDVTDQVHPSCEPSLAEVGGLAHCGFH